MLPGAVRCEVSAITCQLVTRSDWSYELYVVPHWDPSSAVIERFRTPAPALLRHAEVGRRLRENGWIVIDKGTPLGMHRAA
jgi:hypothetical protein